MARRRQSVTIKHVAADAGVSLQTVSRVINKEPNVRATMRERVQASIDKLGYVPSIAAQRMSGSRSYLILSINDRARTIADWEAREGRDWIDQMLLGGMRKAAEHGYRILIELVDTDSQHVERELGNAIAALQPDGVILTPPHSDNALMIDLLEERHIPFARIGSKGTTPGIALAMDDRLAAREATQHLLDLGHERIGFIAGSPYYELSHWRTNGWKDAMREAGHAVAGLFGEGDFGYESGGKAARALLSGETLPTAVIASSDHMAMATLDVARELGLSVPGDLSVISFDDTPVLRGSVPAMTAIDQPIAELASLAVEKLIQAKRGELEDEERAVIPARLVVRDSTAPPRAASHG
ncbi:LacI family DNA-binding transcriptional regulator [Alteriqipengyuania sp. WL0013]|uniref:LacI family DNA-binding transcriptional regulator n=1 Tax=Alteriqipengyuania sp. WL0013 TaxID=3110773 RepID=UPI002C2DCBEA|nr:LacI family DNA-binding transcriptional regulator [Alteriqipengyuania sp. WL0013]MEB3414902.1 LacI family DNA-binding transcriptional regulator [Alteriqipengyuania sp. WL0013]